MLFKCRKCLGVTNCILKEISDSWCTYTQGTRTENKFRSRHSKMIGRGGTKEPRQSSRRLLVTSVYCEKTASSNETLLGATGQDSGRSKEGHIRCGGADPQERGNSMGKWGGKMERTIGKDTASTVRKRLGGRETKNPGCST